MYQDKYVAFVDMLGFSALVRESAENANKIAAIMDAIDRLANTACNNPNTDLRVTYFSDCIVVSSQRTPNGLADILASLRLLAENLLVVDMLIRGGLTVGKICHDSQVMFGPAMLTAYEMECKKAIHPMILVCDQVRLDVKNANLDQYLIWDDEAPDHHYVHYLISYSAYDPTPRPGTVILDSQAALVRHFIANRLQAPSESVREKAEWMERYWNETVAIYKKLAPVDREKDLTKPNAYPFRSKMGIAAPHVPTK